MAEEEKKMGEERPIEINHMPRSLPAKRCADLFSHSSLSHSDVSPQSTVSKDTSTVTLASTGCPDRKMQDTPCCPLVPCSHGDSEVEAMSSQDSLYQSTEEGSYPHDSPIEQSTSRDEERGCGDQILRLTPDDLAVVECQQSCGSPATATTHSSEPQSSSDQLVDVHSEDLNASNDREASGSGTSRSRSTSTSQVEGNSEESGRGKRKRKPKAPFDVKPTSIRSPTKKPRRVKIMRLLGLTAPVGSSFVLPS